MKCDNFGCKKEPYADIQWSGKLPPQTATLCKDCLEEFWEKYRGHIQANLISFRIDKPNAIKKGSDSYCDKVEAEFDIGLYNEYDKKLEECRKYLKKHINTFIKKLMKEGKPCSTSNATDSNVSSLSAVEKAITGLIFPETISSGPSSSSKSPTPTPSP